MTITLSPQKPQQNYTVKWRSLSSWKNIVTLKFCIVTDKKSSLPGATFNIYSKSAKDLALSTNSIKTVKAVPWLMCNQNGFKNKFTWKLYDRASKNFSINVNSWNRIFLIRIFFCIFSSSTRSISATNNKKQSCKCLSLEPISMFHYSPQK